ncbi:hypothetical protein AB395_00004938 (plasmid) [Sinorhizobium fredii CCBAU 45436]|nr:hypothetical protein AB395_00004938 [Sinorhizobium fredii CCBAU 45436]
MHRIEPRRSALVAANLLIGSLEKMPAPEVQPFWCGRGIGLTLASGQRRSLSIDVRASSVLWHLNDLQSRTAFPAGCSGAF